MKIFIIIFILLSRNYGVLEEETIKKIQAINLIENAERYNGRVIIYVGEVIGEVLNRKNFAWINVKDKDYAIGIWCPQKFIKKITCFGSYKYKGDSVEIRGKFHRACTYHTGDLDIHAYSLKVINKGYKLKRNLEVFKLKSIVILSFVVLFLFILNFKKYKKRKIK